jgi:DNA gyrase/topoisomerase IV subunit A
MKELIKKHLQHRRDYVKRKIIFNIKKVRERKGKGKGKIGTKVKVKMKTKTSSVSNKYSN